MTRNRNRYTRSLRMRGLMPLVLVGIVAAGLGCGFVHVKNQHVAKGDQKQELERGIVKLEKEIRTLQLRIAEVTDRNAMVLRLQMQGSDLVKIDQRERIRGRLPSERVAMQWDRAALEN